MLQVKLVISAPLHHKTFCNDKGTNFFVGTTPVKVIEIGKLEAKVKIDTETRHISTTQFSVLSAYIVDEQWTDDDARFMRVADSSIPYILHTLGMVNRSLSKDLAKGVPFRLEYNENIQKLQIPDEVYYATQHLFREG